LPAKRAFSATMAGGTATVTGVVSVVPTGSAKATSRPALVWLMESPEKVATPLLAATVRVPQERGAVDVRVEEGEGEIAVEAGIGRARQVGDGDGQVEGGTGRDEGGRLGGGMRGRVDHAGLERDRPARGGPSPMRHPGGEQLRTLRFSDERGRLTARWCCPSGR
jgi:hypothetical protein